MPTRALGGILAFVIGFAAAAQPRDADVVVYGGTAGGVIAAVTAAREGARVILLEPRTHLGGMVSGGLGWTDFGKKEVIGGASLVAGEFSAICRSAAGTA